MEVHCGVMKSVIGRRVWNKLRMALLMVRKGIISKRKLLMDMNLMMKRGKLLRKTLANLIFHHSNSRSSPPPPALLQPRGSDGFQFRLQDYEFSCSNSPNPVFFHVAKRKHHYLNLKGHFPCINPPPSPLPLPLVDDELSDTHRDEVDMAVLVFPNNNLNLNKKQQQQLPHPEPGGLPQSYSFRFESPNRPGLDHLSPFSVRISNYSDEDEDDNDVGDADSNRGVDDDAEEFIKRFYEQLRVQNRTQFLQSYEEEMQYQEMLARGTR